MIRVCVSCDQKFEAKQINHKTCSKECSTVHKRKQSCDWDKRHSLGIKSSIKTCSWCKSNFTVGCYNVKYCSKNCKHEARLIRVNKRYKEDLNFRIKHNVRSRLYKAIKYERTFSYLTLLGCSIKELKQLLESKFQPGMSWDNYGKWHIDHIVPLANFDLTNQEQSKIACNYVNLQPLWARDNLRKSKKNV